MRVAVNLLAVTVAALALDVSASLAKDYGQSGQTFAIVEPDLLSTIEGRLQGLAASGAIDRANAGFARAAEQRIRRPAPVAGVTRALVDRTWLYDPAITVDHDVRDQKGNLIAARGQRINPLDFVTVRQSLVFIDGDDPAEVSWAMASYTDLNAKIIMVSGSPIEAMTERRRRFYFDQQGRLTAKFGIAHTPAVVVQSGKVMRVSEHVLKAGRGG
ncbi:MULTISPECIES: type-F conjugative transfer system protein TraW [unclassified Sphingomonas]|uniref:type-F conjugative transfer system protein TraW n=1 Tax=unclassified Sphingomonas TaxID=196159 RepID=UPI00092A0492|nr:MULTISPECIES: type-F conjugative transfer system protein TraW [unclassified Sphingomonas]MBN8848030.1 type-F conjugative transfer system protein TraW [Sphingomonas sp.]OJV29738.1 MAG: type-F conjugative transfer system protein TraW [Sphingomonas sp. 67-36]